MGVMIEKIDPNKVYTPEEVRSFLKVSDSTMKRMIKNGVIKAYKVSKQHRIWGSEVLMLLSPKLESKIYKTYSKVRDNVQKTIKPW